MGSLSFYTIDYRLSRLNIIVKLFVLVVKDFSFLGNIITEVIQQACIEIDILLTLLI